MSNDVVEVSLKIPVPHTNGYALFLGNEEKTIVIYVDAFTGEAIRMASEGIRKERPLTHDLLKSVITELGGEVQHSVVSDLRQDTFFAQLVVEQNGTTHKIDSRPSDAIALAVRLEVPIYVEESVMDRAAITPDEEVDAEPLSEDEQRDSAKRLSIFEDFVESLDLDDLEPDDDEE